MKPALILVAVVRKHLATANSIYGAISAYLLIGFAWTLLYLGTARSDGGSWAIDGLPMLSALMPYIASSIAFADGVYQKTEKIQVEKVQQYVKLPDLLV